MQTSTSLISRLVLASCVAGVVADSALGQVLNEDLKLLASDGELNENFGSSVAIDNGTIAVGARWVNDNASGAGGAYVIDAATGTEIVKILSNDGAFEDRLGTSIAIEGGLVVAGAYLEDDNGFDAGAAYIFDSTTGSQNSKLISTDGAASDFFGWATDMDNGVIAIGAYTDDDNGTDSGSAYLFDAASGTQTSKLLPTGGTAGSSFGWSIGISSGIVVVGAPLSDEIASLSGAAYLFDTSTGLQIVKLLPDDGASLDLFGTSVDIDSGIVVVGARWDDENGNNSGSAYLFDAATGTQIAKLLPNDGLAGDEFGSKVAISDGIVAVSAVQADDNGNRSGSAYLFDAATGTQIAKLLPSDGQAEDSFGGSIAIDLGTVVVGAALDDDNGLSSGSAYVFSVPGEECVADTNHDGMLTPADFTAWIAAFNSSAPECDQNNDGSCTPADFTAWIANFNAGCG